MSHLKSRPKLLISLVLSMAMLFFSAVPAYAYATTGYVLTGGVGNYGYIMLIALVVVQ